jgi:hypothetical protein
LRETISFLRIKASHERRFQHEDDEVYEDDDDDLVDETPVRTIKALRIAQPPSSTHARLSGSGMPGSIGPVLPPIRIPADSVDSMASLTLLVKETLKGQASQQAQAVASRGPYDRRWERWSACRGTQPRSELEGLEGY